VIICKDFVKEWEGVSPSHCLSVRVSDVRVEHLPGKDGHATAIPDSARTGNLVHHDKDKSLVMSGGDVLIATGARSTVSWILF
jgi:hypothetical protein